MGPPAMPVKKPTVGIAHDGGRMMARALFSPIDCWNISHVPLLSEVNRTALLSRVQSRKVFHPSSIVIGTGANPSRRPAAKSPIRILVSLNQRVKARRFESADAL